MRDLTISMISTIFSIEIINAVIPDQKVYFWIGAFVADAAAVNVNSTNALLANGLSTIFIKDKPVFSNDPKSLPRNPPNPTILESWFFGSFILADEFAKALKSL